MCQEVRPWLGCAAGNRASQRKVGLTLTVSHLTSHVSRLMSRCAHTCRPNHVELLFCEDNMLVQVRGAALVVDGRAGCGIWHKKTALEWYLHFCG